MESTTLKERLFSLVRHGVPLVVTLTSAALACTLATDGAKAVYILTGTGDSATVLEEGREPGDLDITSKLLYVETGRTGFDVKLSGNQDVAVYYGGQIQKVSVLKNPMTVTEILAQLDIVPNPLEMVAIDLSGPNAIINVSSDITYYDKVQEPVKCQVIRRANPDLPEGTENVVQKGSDGMRTSVYEVKWCNGRELSRQFVETLSSTAKDYIVEYGVKSPGSENESDESDDISSAPEAEVTPVSTQEAAAETVGAAKPEAAQDVVTLKPQTKLESSQAVAVLKSQPENKLVINETEAEVPTRAMPDLGMYKYENQLPLLDITSTVDPLLLYDPEPVAEVSDPVPETVAEVNPELGYDAAPVIEYDPAPVSEPEPEPEPAPEPEPEPVPEPEPEPEPEPVVVESTTSDTRSPIASVSKNADGSGVLTLESGDKLVFTASKAMTATAYTSGYDRVGTITASGKRVKVGYVAVDRRVIPLGTRLFIQTNDGIVYGTAVAEDTGVRGNIIDLYMNTYRECINFGRRACTVYILK